MYSNKFMRKKANVIDDVKEAWRGLSKEQQRALINGGIGFTGGAVGNLLLGDSKRTAGTKALDALGWGALTGLTAYGATHGYNALQKHLADTKMRDTTKQNNEPKEVQQARKDVKNLAEQREAAQAAIPGTEIPSDMAYPELTDAEKKNKQIRDYPLSGLASPEERTKLLNQYDPKAYLEGAKRRAAIDDYNAELAAQRAYLNEVKNISDEDLDELLARPYLFGANNNQIMYSDGRSELLQEGQDLPMGTLSAGNRDVLIKLRDSRSNKANALKRLKLSQANGDTNYLLTDKGLAQKQKAKRAVVDKYNEALQKQLLSQFGLSGNYY